MESVFSFINEYINGKPVYPVARRLLSFLFSLSITSFFFEKLYFNYQWINITDYKAILDFLIKGYFFVPLCLFVIVHYSLQGISLVFFTLMTVKKSSNLLKKLYAIEFKKTDSLRLIQSINDNPISASPFPFQESHFYELYQHLVTNIPKKQMEKFESGLKIKKEACEQNFYLIIKALFTVTIYFFAVSYFGWLLYFTTLLILITLLFVLYCGYLLLDLAPAAIKKFDYEVSRYLADGINPQHTET